MQKSLHVSMLKVKKHIEDAKKRSIFISKQLKLLRFILKEKKCIPSHNP